MIIGIDHILIAVDDLVAASTVFQNLGFNVLVGGEHPRMGTHNALISLADGVYLELVGVKNPVLAQQFNWTRHVLNALATSYRLAYVALDSDELLADVSAIRARGLMMEDVIPGARRRPDGQEARWQMVDCVDTALPFLIQDITPRTLRVPVPTQGLGMTTRLFKLIWQTPVLTQRLKQFELLLQQAPIDQQFHLTRGTIELVSGADERLVEVQLTIDDLPSVLETWSAKGIIFHQQQNSKYYELDVRETCGAKLVFK